MVIIFLSLIGFKHDLLPKASSVMPKVKAYKSDKG